ncbi:YihY/virulence factor BrkB family protein [Anaeromyxobacter oryzisoli]|uniref:YihY/virulence factor BrkB family protein n=1 Tax=Anaeromyxobacter oryzisoli TaxID=2925408 RepID=UPI001F59B14B|nr:YihY/virulence factor BrkB family protein [Anaeromyxobacter sp. SG63]
MRFPGKGMSWKEFGKGLYAEIDADGVTDLAAAVTYYGVLALFPFLLFLVALASLLITPAQAQQLVEQLSRVAPGAVTQIVGERIQQLARQQHVTLIGFGALGALWAASGAVLAVMRALNTCYDVRESRPFWKTRGIAVGMTIVTGVLSLVAALLGVAAEPIANAIGGPIGTAILWARLPIAGLAMMFLWALLYYVLPDVEQEFKFITPGSVVGVVIWVLASWGFGKYVANFGSYDKTYGSIAGVVVLFLWMWISSLVLLGGAEMNAFIEHRSPEGKREGAKSMRDTGTAPAARHHEGAAAMQDRLGGSQREVEETPAVARRPSRGPLRGLAAVAAGFAAGVLVARREA